MSLFLFIPPWSPSPPSLTLCHPSPLPLACSMPCHIPLPMLYTAHIERTPSVECGTPITGSVVHHTRPPYIEHTLHTGLAPHSPPSPVPQAQPPPNAMPMWPPMLYAHGLPCHTQAPTSYTVPPMPNVAPHVKCGPHCMHAAPHCTWPPPCPTWPPTLHAGLPTPNTSLHAQHAHWWGELK